MEIHRNNGKVVGSQQVGDSWASAVTVLISKISYNIALPPDQENIIVVAQAVTYVLVRPAVDHCGLETP